MCNSSSSVLVLNRTSPSLLHTFVAYTTQLSIAIQHTRNSFLHPHIPCKRLRAYSCAVFFREKKCKLERWLSKLDYHGNINVKVHAMTTLKCFHINISEISLSLAVKPSTVVRLFHTRSQKPPSLTARAII